MGRPYALAGRLTEARSLLEQPVEQPAARRVLLGRTLRLAWLSEAHLLAGRVDDASPLAIQALDLSRQSRERGQEA